MTNGRSKFGIHHEKHAVLVSVLSLLFSVAPALSHAMLDHASLRVGNTVASAPKEVVLWFTQKLEPAFSSAEVRNEQSGLMNSGKASVVGDGTQLRVPVKPLSPGTYRVIWHVLSFDTHRTQGDFSFRVGSTNDHARPWDSKPRQRDLTPVLHRPVEPAVKSGHADKSAECPLYPPKRTSAGALNTALFI